MHIKQFWSNFCPLRAKKFAQAVLSEFSIFPGSLNVMLVHHTSLIYFLRSPSNRFYPDLKFGIDQKWAKIAKISIFRDPLSLFRDKMGLS